MSGDLPKGLRTFRCYWPHEFVIKALLCNTQYFYITLCLDNIERKHCCFSTATIAARTRLNVHVIRNIVCIVVFKLPPAVYKLCILKLIICELCWTEIRVFISVFNQLDAQNLFHNKFYFMSLHVSSTCAHHHEVKIVLHSLWYHHTYRCDDTRGCVISVVIPEAV